MGISFHLCFAFVSFAVNTAAQFSQVIQTDLNGKKEYVAGSSTSSVAAPNFTPILVYNCYYMPLICENVASYAKGINPGGNGDLAAQVLFHFDPSTSSLESRRAKACGCFQHDGCDQAKSNGKSDGTSVTIIAKRAPFDTLNTPMSQADKNTILQGANPPTNEQRVGLTSVPGRFFGVNGVAFSCDEFPAATFIEGGNGIGGNGNKAKTICAMQSWQIYKGGANAVGKWPLAGTGQQREQDWQGRAHGLLRNALNIGSSRNQRGWGTVYPFYFTTITLQPQAQTKAYVIRAAQVTSSVLKRDGTPTTSTYLTTTTVGVFDDGTSELRRRDYEADKSSQYDNGEEMIGSAVPRFGVRQALEPAETSSPSLTVGSNQTSSMTTAPGLSSSSAVFPFTNTSISMSLSISTASSVTQSTLQTIQVSSSSGNNSITNIGSSSLSMVPPSATPSSTRASSSSLTETLLSSTTLATQGSTASNIQSSGVIVAGSPAATSSASAVSSNVASASSAAAALAADPSNKQKAQTAQKQTHDAENAAAALLGLAVRGSPLASALSSLVDSLGTAAAQADAAVDATTPAAVSAAVADLVSDLGDAAKDAEEVKEESEDDDDKPSTSPSATEPSQSRTSQASQTTPSSQTSPSSITSSASLTASTSGSLSSATSSQSNSSISTQTSASAQPSQCTLSFDVDGDEDIEVGDDGLDDDPGDDGICNPVYGPGGSIIPCGPSASSANSSIPASEISSPIPSGTGSSASPTGFITSSYGPNTTTDVSTSTSSPSQHPSTPISAAPSTSPTTSSSPTPPPPPPSTTSSPTPPPPPPSTPPAPPTPSQTSSNNKGSSLCSSIGGTTCKLAYSQYNDTYLYTAYTSYVLGSGDNSIVNDLFPLYANDGCTAMFKCDSDADYAVGMTGAQIKAAFDNLFQNDNVKVCGSSYLSNACHVTVNGCDDCKPSVPCGSLDAANIANKFPCYN